MAAQLTRSTSFTVSEDGVPLFTIPQLNYSETLTSKNGTYAVVDVTTSHSAVPLNGLSNLGKCYFRNVTDSSATNTEIELGVVVSGTFYPFAAVTVAGEDLPGCLAAGVTPYARRKTSGTGTTKLLVYINSR